MRFHVDQFLVRGRQAACKWFDRLRAPQRRLGPSWNPFNELAAGGALRDMRRFLQTEDYWGAAATLRHHLADHLPGRFFAGAFNEAIVARFKAEERPQIVAAADAVCQGRFDFLGYQALTFGDPVDWHLDPVARRRVPLVHWSRIDPSDVSVCGDSRIIWQLNRHQWLVLLGEAYRFTSDVRYAERFDETIRDWIRMNPVGMGINWVNSQEVAHRLIAWCWALALFWPATLLTADFLVLMLDQIRLHAEHLDRYRSSGDDSAAAQTVEGLALLYAGVLFPEFRLADRWCRTGLSIVSERILTDVSPEGLYCDQSTAHQRLAIEAYLHFLILAERNGQPIWPAICTRVDALLTALLQLQRPDGRMMRIGEADGEWLLPFVSRNRDDWRGLFAVAAAVFENPHYAWAAGGETPELLWLLGSAGIQRYGNLVPVPPQGQPSQDCARNGFVQMRSGWERQSHQLILGVGSSGEGHTGGRAQGDVLSIQCSVFGEPMVVAPDLSGPAGHREWQQFVNNTRAHSTILVDGVSPGAATQSRRASTSRGPRTVLRQWSSNDRFELVDAEHDGYRMLDQPVIHRRRVLFIKRAYWILIDDLEGTGHHRIDLVFQLAALQAERDASLWTKIWTAHGPGLAIKPFTAVPLTAEIRDGVNDSRADRLGRRATPTLAYRGEADMPARVVTLLYPLRDRQATVPAVMPFVDEQGRFSGLTVGDPPATILYSDHSVTVEAA